VNRTVRPELVMIRAGWPRPSMRCTTLRVALLLGEDDGHGPVDEPVGPAVCPAALSPGATVVALELGAPGLIDPLGSGSVESGLLVAAPGVPVAPELGSLGEVSLVVGDGEVEVGTGVVDVGPGEVLVLVGGELLGAPDDGLMLGEAEPLARWHLLATDPVGEGVPV
jgi:hypothetical protein